MHWSFTSWNSVRFLSICFRGNKISLKPTYSLCSAMGFNKCHGTLLNQGLCHKQKTGCWIYSLSDHLPLLGNFFLVCILPSSEVELCSRQGGAWPGGMGAAPCPAVGFSALCSLPRPNTQPQQPEHPWDHMYITSRCLLTRRVSGLTVPISSFQQPPEVNPLSADHRTGASNRSETYFHLKMLASFRLISVVLLESSNFSLVHKALVYSVGKGDSISGGIGNVFKYFDIVVKIVPRLRNYRFSIFFFFFKREYFGCIYFY